MFDPFDIYELPVSQLIVTALVAIGITENFQELQNEQSLKHRN